MIDQSLINHIEAVIEDSQGSAVDISTGRLVELLDSYKALIEQNADLHKQSEKYKAQIVELVKFKENVKDIIRQPKRKIKK